MTGMMPAAALAYRRGDIARAKKTIALDFTDDPRRIFYDDIDAGNSMTIRTAIETHRFAIALPKVKELPWLSPATVSADDGGAIERVADLQRDYTGRNVIVSDTLEIRRDFVQGLHTVVTPRTISAAGWFEDEALDLGLVTMDVDNAAAAVVVNAMDDKPIHESARLLLTAIARSRLIDSNKRFVSEPVRGRVHLKNNAKSLHIVPLGSDGRRGKIVLLQKNDQGAFDIDLSHIGGTHWWIIEAK
jgi:hypothetical protein